MRKFTKSKKRLLEAQKEGNAGNAPEGKKKHSSTFWIGIFIAGIMILSVVGFMWKGGETGQSYNGTTMKYINNYWYASVDGKDIKFYNYPAYVESINISSQIVDSLKSSKMVYVTSDPDDMLKDEIGLIEFEMKEIMEKRGIFFVYSFTKENDFNKTVITCQNSTASVPVIYFKFGNETRFDYQDSCIIVEATTANNMVTLRDRMLYAFFDIIK